MTFYCHAQSQTERIAKEICDKLNDVNLDQNSEFSNNKSIEIIQSTYLRNQESIKKLISEYSKTYTNKSDIEIAKLVGRDITFYLMKNCNVYQRITMFKNKPVPNISTTTEKVGEDFTELLTVKNQNKQYFSIPSWRMYDQSNGQKWKRIGEKFWIKIFVGVHKRISSLFNDKMWTLHDMDSEFIELNENGL